MKLPDIGLLPFKLPVLTMPLIPDGQMSTLGDGQLPSVSLFTNNSGFSASSHPDYMRVGVRP